jgi:prephenate dehydrogenase
MVTYPFFVILTRVEGLVIFNFVSIHGIAGTCNWGKIKKRVLIHMISLTPKASVWNRLVNLWHS